MLTAMKKSALLIIVFILGLSTDSFGQFAAGGQVVTIQEVKEMPDESLVMLEGYIVKNLGDEHYIFRDDTGKIEIEIDDDVWGGQKVDPETKIRIQGEFDKDFTSKTIDVQRIIINPGSEANE